MGFLMSHQDSSGVSSCLAVENVDPPTGRYLQSRAPKTALISYWYLASCMNLGVRVGFFKVEAAQNAALLKW